MKHWIRFLTLVLVLLMAGSAIAEGALNFDGEIEPEKIEEIGLLDIDDTVITIAEPEAYPAANAAGVKINSANFPDKAFRSYVKAQYDKDGDGTLSPDEANSVVEMFIGEDDERFVQVKCSNMKGLKFFPNLKLLAIVRCPVKSLDVSGNTKLELLICCFTNVEKVDVSKNTRLTELNVGSSKVKTLKLGKQKHLETLVCDNNKLKLLDVTKCPNITYLQCHDNKLSELDVSKCTKLQDLYCGNNQLKALDVTRNRKLIDLWCDCNRLKTIDVTKNTKLEEFNPSENPLGQLDITKNTKLRVLACDSNKLTSLNVSKNKKLEVLIAHSNKIKSIDIGNCPVLKKYLKKKATIKEGHAIWFGKWEDEDYTDLLNIDKSTKLMDGNKVLYPTA